MSDTSVYEGVISFWFNEIDSSFWFKKDLRFDQDIRDRFAITHSQAVKGELFAWRNEPLGRLAEVIVLDQFSRNMFRDSADSFAFDSLALILAQEAIAVGADKQLKPVEKSFLYMPYMHSESATIHALAVDLFAQPGLENNLEFEHRHKNIIDRFGRYPHRNEILGRKSTSDELEFLQQPGSSF